MLRISRFMQELLHPQPVREPRSPPGPVVIWNLVRRCNLLCKHCYSISADTDFANELTTEQVFEVMDDLKQYRVPVLILSGGEPLLRPDIYQIAHRSKAMGFYTALSTNGTLIDEHNIGKIAEVDFDYIGISIDGIASTHDVFRRKEGSFAQSIKGLRLCRDHDIKVGVRFTMTEDNAKELPQMFELLDSERIDKFYLSHLNYAGRGDKNRQEDALHATTRWAMDLLFERALSDQQSDKGREYVTGNNDSDGVYLLHWVRQRFPQHAERIEKRLIEWGGNSTGVNVANIDNLGNVHPDTMWWHYTLGSVIERPFSEIWSDTSDPIMARLKAKPRVISGRCGSCRHFNICAGNTRVRAEQISGDPWAEDPACYLSDQEIGLSSPPLSGDERGVG